MTKSYLLRIILVSLTLALPFALLGLIAVYTGTGHSLSDTWQQLQAMDNFGLLYSKMYGVVFLSILIGASLINFWPGGIFCGGSGPCGHADGGESGHREEGEVKWFNGKKGYGFIRRENGEEIFVHYREIQSQGQGRKFLRDGQRVSFVVGEGAKGKEAQEVEIV
jgi:CspA family cold shock protein